jgi:hypothetical protein
MALAHDLDLLPLVMVVGNLLRLGLAAPPLADSAHLSTPDENWPSPLEEEGREGGEAGRRLFSRARSRISPHLAWRGAP